MKRNGLRNYAISIACRGEQVAFWVGEGVKFCIYISMYSYVFIHAFLIFSCQHEHSVRIVSILAISCRSSVYIPLDSEAWRSS